MNPLAPLVAIARAEIGHAENPIGSNRGPQIEKYLRATNLDGDGWPWCAAFVCWCVQEFMRQCPGVVTIPPPRTASAYGLATWGEQNGCLVLNPSPSLIVVPGDILIFTWSHAGIDIESAGRALRSVEGNSTSDRIRDGHIVGEHPRKVSDLLHLVRLPVRALPS